MIPLDRVRALLAAATRDSADPDAPAELAVVERWGDDGLARCVCATASDGLSVDLARHVTAGDGALYAAAPDLAADHLALAEALATAERERDEARVALAPLPASWLDALTAPHIDFTFAAFGGSVRLASASGPLESLRLMMVNELSERVSLDRATGQHLAASVRLTPSQAREFATLLIRYADTHKETP